MAAARKLDSKYGGNRSGRQQSPPATSSGWGGHTISKSFTQLAWDGYDDAGHSAVPHDTRELGPNNTFVTSTLVKDKYVGTGHGIQQPPPMRSFSSSDATRPGLGGDQRTQMGLRQWDTIDLSGGGTDNTGTTSTRGSDSLQRPVRGYTGGDARVQKELTRSVTYGGVDAGLRDQQIVTRNMYQRSNMHDGDPHRMGNVMRDHQVDRNVQQRSYVHVEDAPRSGAGQRDSHVDRNVYQRSSMRIEDTPRAGGTDHLYMPRHNERSVDSNRDSRMIQDNLNRPRQDIDMGGFDGRQILRQSTVVNERPVEASRDSRIIHEPQRQQIPTRSTHEMGSFDRRSHLVSQIAADQHAVATPAVARSTSGGWQSHWKIRDSPVLRRQHQVSSTLDNLDLHIYDYMRYLKQEELASILLKCQLESNVTLKFLTQSNDENDAVRNMFQALYKKVEQSIWIEEFDISDVNNAKDLKLELEDKYAVLVYLTGHNKLQVISDNNNMNNITNLINKAGGICLRHQAIERESVVQVHAPQIENKVMATVNFPPRGYLVYGMVKVYIHLCDITKMHVDVVVNAANQFLEHHGGVARAISSAAGPELEAACSSIIQRGGPVPTTQVVRTTAGDMPCKYVLHAVGPKWPDQPDRYKSEQCLRDLRGTIDNILGFAFETGMETIALPPISSGVYGVPGDFVSEAIFASISTAVQKYFFHEDNHLKEIHIVDLKSDILRHLTGLCENARETRGPEIIRNLSDDEIQHTKSSIFAPRERMIPTMRQIEHRQMSHSPMGSNPDVRFEARGYLLLGNIKVIVNMADIAMMNVDAIVNPTDEHLSKRNNASLAIAMAGGPNYDRALDDVVQTRGPIQPGQVTRTIPGRLPCETVLHLVGPHEPSQDKFQQEQCIRDIQIGFNNVIEYACRNGIESIAVPLFNGMFMVPEKYVVDALHEAIVRHLPDIYSSSTNLKTIHVVDTRPELLIDLLHHFDNDMRQPGLQRSIVTTLNRRTMETSIQQSTTPPYPPKLVADMHSIVENNREVMRRDGSRHQKWESDQHLDRSPGWESASDADRHSDPGRHPQKKKSRKRVVVTKRKAWSSKKSSGSSQQSGPSSQHKTNHKPKSNPLDCFKTGRSSPKHEITIEHPHYDDTERRTNLAPPPLTNNTSYHDDHYAGPQVNRGFVDHVDNRNPPLSSQSRSRSYQDYPTDRMSQEYQYTRTSGHDYHRGTMDRQRTLQY